MNTAGRRTPSRRTIFEIDHILPRSLGGLTESDNLARACGGCNVFKGVFTEAPDPDGGEVVRLFNPRTDLWREHFLWSYDRLGIIGLSPTGRATVSTLRMNRDSARNLRRALRAIGKHPPRSFS